MKTNKAVCTYDLAVELIKSKSDFGIDKLMKMPSESYETRNIPADLSQPIFIALPIKPAASGLPMTISIMYVM